MKTLGYFDETREEYIRDNEASVEKVITCVKALKKKDNTYLYLSTGTSVLTIMCGKRQRYHAKFHFDKSGKDPKIVCLVDNEYLSDQSEIPFRDSNGEIHCIRLYETVTQEIAIKAATHYWATEEVASDLTWITKPTIRLGKRESS
jgi:hypothetical protein